MTPYLVFPIHARLVGYTLWYYNYFVAKSGSIDSAIYVIFHLQRLLALQSKVSITVVKIWFCIPICHAFQMVQGSSSSQLKAPCGKGYQRPIKVNSATWPLVIAIILPSQRHAQVTLLFTTKELLEQKLSSRGWAITCNHTIIPGGWLGASWGQVCWCQARPRSDCWGSMGECLLAWQAPCFSTACPFACCQCFHSLK